MWPFILSIMILGAIAVTAGYMYFDRPAGDGSKKVEFIVKNGWGPFAITSQLQKDSLIKSKFNFNVMLLLKGKSSAMKRGIYDLDDSMGPSEIIDTLTSGKTKTVTFTIPEGYNNNQIAEQLVKKGLFKTKESFTKIASSPALLSKFNIKSKSAEGYLFPDTYTVPARYPEEKIIALMINHFFEKVTELKGFPEDPGKRQRLVILASIVEREAKAVEERPIIASIFYNRIQKNMPLESCATIQYLFDAQRKRIFFRDLEIVSPYNTYRNRGLPIGPISNPGLSSLNAVLNPAATEYIFFVVKGDGTHHFSKTFNEHVKAKKEYLSENGIDVQ